MVIVILITAFPSSAIASKDIPSWQPYRTTSHWILRIQPMPLLQRNAVYHALTISYPPSQKSRAGDFAAWRVSITVPRAKRYALSFWFGDTFTGSTAGYHIAQVLINDHVIWECDVAGGTNIPQRFVCELTKAISIHHGKSTSVTVTIRIMERRGVANFPIMAYWMLMSLHADGRVIPLMRTDVAHINYEPFPVDLPLPTASINDAWTRTATVLQPWGRTQWVAIAQHDKWVGELRDDFGFNTIIVLPPDAHNTTGRVFYDRTGKLRLTDEQFSEALTHYRRAGFHIILYSSIMHCGHAPVWMSGELVRQHPDWVQRDKDGTPRTLYGGQWLCPSTPALNFTLQYTQGIVRAYDADAVMLDNNEFFLSDARQPTCYCRHCQRRFREYIRRRFGDATRKFFGVNYDEITIPTDEGSDLFRLWIHWRNRLWAEATETFRMGLREVKRNIVLLANTQYRYPSWYLATDMQYSHEDVVLSESRRLTSWQMSAKMLLGKALAGSRPLWNYVGTFEERRERGCDYLRPPDVIATLLASTFAHHANPWIVFHGFDTYRDENAPSLAMLKRYIRWFADHAVLLGNAKPTAPIAVFFSLRSRNYTGAPLIPECVDTLLKMSAQLVGIVDESFDKEQLHGVEALVMQSVTCLSEKHAIWIAEWVRRGGILLATPDCGWRDEYGRLRPHSALMNALGITAHEERYAIGKGEVIWVSDAQNMLTALRRIRARCNWVDVTPRIAELELTCASSEVDGWQFLIHLVHHQNGATPTPLQVKVLSTLFPKRPIARIIWLSPDNDDGALLQWNASHNDTILIQTPPLHTYGVILIQLK